MRSFFAQPFLDLVAAMEKLVEGPRLLATLAAAFGTLPVAWILYVPVHELLHVAGCVGTGGSVTELEIQPLYGGAILERVFPFVVAGGEYAGRLSGFDTGGSDFVYLATDFAPYLLTIFLGVPALRACARRQRPFLFAVAVVLAFTPFMSIPGDFYEMGSILVTGAASGFASGAPAFEGVRSDDVFALVETLSAKPSELGLGPDETGPAAVLVGVSLVLSVLLAFATYALGGAFANRVGGPAREPTSTPDPG